MNATHAFRHLAAASLLTFLTLASPGFAAAAENTSGTTWTLSPAGPDGADERISLRHVMEPGARVDDRVALTNFTPGPATFAVYASDGVVTADGNFDLLPPGETPVDAGSWIDIGAVDGQDPLPNEPLTIELPAGGSVVIPLTITVPENASPGDHPAGLVAQFVPGDGAGVEMASRVGVRVHLRVDGPVVASLDVDQVEATYEPSWNPFAPGTVHVAYSLGNSGNVRLGATSTATVTGPFGIAPSSASASTREILPGQEAHLSSSFDLWPLVLGFGEVQVTPQVVGEDALADAGTPQTATLTVWTVPWAQLCLIAAAVLITFAVLRLRRRSAAQTQRRIDDAVAQALTAGVPETGEQRDQSSGAPVEARTARRG
ncbi:hypothetical protein QSU92_06630 [Microbacterium sp. ET2]|uniref:hypothetical protein n=1 Tax=Microbacterium albipurpureum TaxID=3050384 RepID=UPI00259CFD60|nr:hypothetical protein [Microbacterium sp. ET2 (Ac-2212)]WJL96844.1 hypothetical protein QSU92_06630 [Microbacterium sp. ET2 (Ac-2212)]